MNPKHINNTTNDTNAIVELSDAELTEVSGGAAVDYFLRIEGVEGESTSSHGGGGGGGGKANVENLSITR